MASPIRDKSALSVAKVLVRDVITKFGCFQSLQTDNGKEFQNEIIKHICQLLNIDQLRITSYRPSGNGRCEIINKTLHSLMGRVVADSQKDWSQWLSMCVLAYNTSRHESTGQTPYYLMYSREAIIPLDLLLGNFERAEGIDYNAYAEETEVRMRRAFDLVQKHQDAQIGRMKRYYNVGVKPKTFKVNDLVYYYYPRRYAGRTPKWSRVYSGVYRIEKVVNDAVYVIRKTPQSRPIVANVDKLKLYYGEVPMCWRKLIKNSDGKGGNDCGQKTNVSAPLTGEIAASIADKAAEFSGLKISGPVTVSRPHETATEDAKSSRPPFSGPKTRRPHDVTETSRFSGQDVANAPRGRQLVAQPVKVSGLGADLSGRPVVAETLRRSERTRRKPSKYCLAAMGKEHVCDICGFRYRSRGSCHKHTVKKHGMKYVPGQALRPVPADELEELRETYRRADMNRYARAREQRRAAPPAPRDFPGSSSAGQRRRYWRDDSGSPVPPRVRPSEERPVENAARSSFRPHRVGKTAESTCPHPAADGAYETAFGHGGMRPTSAKPFVYRAPTPDLLICNELQCLSSSTEDLVDELARDDGWVRTVRTANYSPMGDESSAEAHTVGCNRDRPSRDVSAGHSTSPKRRHTARRTSDGIPKMTADATDATRRSTAVPPQAKRSMPLFRMRDVAVLARPSAADVAVETVLPSTQDDETMTTPPPVRDVEVTAEVQSRDTAVDPPAIDDIRTWQVPPQIDLRSIAVLLIQRPDVNLRDLQVVAEQHLPRVDTSPHGSHAVRLAFQAMQVYGEELARRLQDIATTAYVDDHTGWLSLRSCATLLQTMISRIGPPLQSPASPSPTEAEGQDKEQDEEQDEEQDDIYL